MANSLLRGRRPGRASPSTPPGRARETYGNRLAYFYSIRHLAIHIQEDKARLIWEVVCDSQGGLPKDYVPAASVWSDFYALQLSVVLRETALSFATDYEAMDPTSGVRYSI